MLPIEIQMQIDITAQMHKREIADGFAKLRENLLPLEPTSLFAQMQMSMNDVQRAYLGQANLSTILNPMLGQQSLHPYWYRLSAAHRPSYGLWP